MSEEVKEPAVEVQEQKAPNPYDESSWATEPVKAEEKQNHSTEQQPEKNEDVVVVDAKPEAKLDEVKFDTNAYLKDKFGVDNEDAAKAAFDEWKALKENSGKTELQFANETSRKFYDYLKEGKEDDVYNFLQSKRELAALDKLSAAEGLKMQLKYANTHFTKEDIQDVFEEKYTVPNKPVQDLDETDDEYGTRVSQWETEKSKVERRIERDWKVAKDDLAKLNSELVLPDIQKPQSEEEKLQKELEEKLPQLREMYEKTLEGDYKNFNGYSVTFKDKDVEIPISFVPTEDEKAALKAKLGEFDSNDYLGNRWFDKDGKPNIVQSMNDIYLLENKDKIFQKIADDAAGRRLELYINSIKNIDVNGKNPEGNFDPNPNPQQGMAGHFFSN